MKLKKFALAGTSTAVLGLIIVACGGSDPIDIASGSVIQNVNVVNTRDGTLLTGMNVVIDGTKILKITRSSIRATGTAQAIDATGKFVVPGYLDMHTHLFNVAPADPELPLLQKLFIANGITGIREMGGSPDFVARARQHNADVAAGKFDAPEILQIPGRIIGFPPIPGFDGGAPPAAAVSAAAATLEVQAQKAYGVGFIKTIGASRDASLAMLAEAKTQGLGVAGHLNPSLSAKESSNAGWRAVEHLGSSMGALLDCSADEDSIRATLLSGNGVTPAPNPPSFATNVLNAPLFQRVFNTYDASKCQALAQTFAKNETWHVPTLIRVRTGRFLEDSVYRTDPNLIYVSKVSRATWEAAAVQRLAAFPAPVRATFQQYHGLEVGITKLMKQNGVKMLTGSDTSISNLLSATWVIPGFALHQEFALLAAAGLTPLDILQMTTLNGAQFLNREATMGTVDENKNADLVLLDANPVDSAANLSKISGMFLKGKYFSAAALAKLKSDVAQAYANQPVAVINLTLEASQSTHTD